MQHLDEGTIHAWLDGALDADSARRIEAHLAECGACASAVAEARGLMAASSRILSALDVVPSDVIPGTQADAPQPSVSSARGPRRGWLPRTARMAAVVACVAVGATIAGRVFGVRAVPPVQPSHTDAGGWQAISAPPTVAGVQPVPAPSVDSVAAAPTPPAHSTSKASDRAQQQARNLERARAEFERQLALSKAADVNAPRAVAAVDTQHVALDSLLRLVSTDRVVTVIGSVVQRRIYEVRPGVRVTLEEAAAPRANFAQPLEARKTARESAPAAAPGVEVPPRPRSAAAMIGSRAAAADSVVVNSIQWTDSAGTHFTLSGPLPVEELRRLQAVVH